MHAVVFPKIFRLSVVQHALFWLVGALVLRITLTQAYPDGVAYTASDILTRILIHIVGLSTAVYFNLRVLIPKLFATRKYLLYFGSVLITLVAAAFFLAGLYRLIFLGILPIQLNMRPPRLGVVVVFFIQAAVFVIASSLLHFVKEWVVYKDTALEMAELERKKLQAELLVLRAQLNPHFLFNALNNLYALSLDASPKTPDLILKLSDLMRYILYECRPQRVSLDKELEFLQNYLELERLRVADDVDIQLKTVGQLNGQQVAPLLFMPLVENAFKHGVGSQVDGAFVHILLQFDQPNELLFRIENSRETSLVVHDETPYGGVGLQNIRKRLALLYPKKHTFAVEDNDNFYRVQLTIPTA